MDIPIRPEEEASRTHRRFRADQVVFSYSDVSHEYVMHKASLCLALGADFILLGPEKTMIGSSRRVVSVCAVRTGAGKSGVTRYIAGVLTGMGMRPVAIRHPMPYSDLLKNRVQRYGSLSDVRACGCTIEEREEYEPLAGAGVVVYAGVDYKAIVEQAEKEADVLLWDGGNNDLPFIRPDLEVVVLDPLRAGHELSFHPGEANLRRADLAVINKVNSAGKDEIAKVEENIRKVNRSARIVHTASRVSVDSPDRILGRRVLVVEDGPTLTHGGMAYGAGVVAAREYRRSGTYRPEALCHRLDTGNLRETSSYRQAPSGHGLLGPADEGTQGDHRVRALRSGAHSDARGSAGTSGTQKGGRTGHL